MRIKSPIDEQLDAWLWEKASADGVICCNSATVQAIDAYDGSYGCETGCEYARLEAVVTCDVHGKKDWEYGTFGDLASLLDEFVENRNSYVEQLAEAQAFVENHIRKYAP